MHNLNDGDQPVGAPTKGAATPWRFKLEYKSGKTAAGLSDLVTPERVKAGLSYYDKEQTSRIQIESELTLCIVAVLSGVSGAVKDARDNYTNYSSNLVQDTRSDILNVWIQGIPKPVYRGKYMDIKASLPQGVGYTRYLICYVPELQELVSLELTVGLGIAIEKAIADACGKKQKDISLFNLCELAQFWVLKVAHEFEKMDKDGNPYSGQGDMYFIPKIRAFVITETGKYPELYAELCQYSDGIKEYLLEKQARIKSFGDETSPEDETTAPPPPMEDNHQSVADVLPDAPTLPPPANDKTPAKFWMLLDKRLTNLSNPATIIVDLGMLYKELSKPDLMKNYGVTIEQVCTKFTEHYRRITGDNEGVFTGGELIPGPIPSTSDNLPF